MNRIKLILLIPSLLFFSSCLYIPTPDHGSENVISDDAINFFIPGKTTRADVLLRFGKPNHRFNNDRYFLYEWEKVVGVLMFPCVPASAGGVSVRAHLHYLCIEFTPDNILKSYKHFEEKVSEKNAEKQVVEWMNQNSNQGMDE